MEKLKTIFITILQRVSKDFERLFYWICRHNFPLILLTYVVLALYPKVFFYNVNKNVVDNNYTSYNAKLITLCAGCDDGYNIDTKWTNIPCIQETKLAYNAGKYSTQYYPLDLSYIFIYTTFGFCLLVRLKHRFRRLKYKTLLFNSLKYALIIASIADFSENTGLLLYLNFDIDGALYLNFVANKIKFIFLFVVALSLGSLCLLNFIIDIRRFYKIIRS
jgi:hypothetical protein